jgi:hypothetical protein
MPKPAQGIFSRLKIFLRGVGILRFKYKREIVTNVYLRRE